MTITRRSVMASAAGIGLLKGLGISAASAQDASTPVKIGYSISLTGPNAGGAATTILPNYQLWAHELREKGGIMVGNVRRPIEIIEYDDRSVSEEAVRNVERLITQDRVDILLAPWGTGLNLAVGPLFHRAGYIQATPTAITDRAPELAGRWPNFFPLSGTAASWAEPVVELMAEARAAGHIDNDVAMISVADAFGIDLAAAARTAYAAHGFNLVYDRSYPVGTQDFSSILAEVRDVKAFSAFSYPPDTIAITENAQLHNFNPAVMYVGIGGAFPMFLDRFGESANTLLTHGGLDLSNERVQAYIALHQDVTGRRPDSAGSIVMYAALQAMEQAIERTGSLSGEVISAELKSGQFETALGQINLGSQMMPNIFKAGQIRDGWVVGLGPSDTPGRGEFIMPKTPWPAR